MTNRHLRRRAAAILAATTSVLPVALWNAQPAAAEPGPLSLTIAPDGCSLSGAGEGYGQLVLYADDGEGLRYVTSSNGPTLTAEYGDDWLIAEGVTFTFTLVGTINGQHYAEVGSLPVGPCQTGTTLELSVVDIGTPPSAEAAVQSLFVEMCDNGTAPPPVLLAAGPPATVPIPADVAICVGLGQSEALHRSASPSSVTVAPGGTAGIVVTVEWIGQRVDLRVLSLVGGQLVPGPPPGSVDVVYSWQAIGGGVDTATGECGAPDAAPGELDCTVGVARIRPGGTFEVAAAGVPAGWTLQRSVFDESHCQAPSDPDSSASCELTLVHLPPPAPPLPPAPPAPPSPPAPGAVCDPTVASPFVDVAASSVHLGNVVCAADLGLVVGGPAGLPADRFGPTMTTSRAQLASLVVNLLRAQGVVLPQGAPDAFADDEGIVHEASIDQLAALGIVGGNGESGSSFHPTRPATRSEIASFLRRGYELAAGAALPAGPDAFVDDEGDPAEADIDALAAAGILAGKAPGIFDPAGTVTREQIATLFVRLVEHLAGPTG